MTELERAIELYTTAPGPGANGEHVHVTARVTLATARLRGGGIKAARAAAGPVLDLPLNTFAG